VEYIPSVDLIANEVIPVEVVKPNLLRTLGASVEVGRIPLNIAQLLLSMTEDNHIQIQGYCENGVSIREVAASTEHSTEGGARDVVFAANLYGPVKLADLVGTFLSDFGLYLQDPYHCDRDVEYRNPHLLPEPDGEVVSISSLSQSTGKIDRPEIQSRDAEHDLMKLLQNNQCFCETDGGGAVTTPLYR